jgi:ribosomal protein S18 acetylase RimI-like enzyme
MDFLRMVRATEEKLSQARNTAPGHSLKKTTALWIELPSKSDKFIQDTLYLHPIATKDDWQSMAELRAKVESRFGTPTPDAVVTMITEIQQCQQRLNSQWYLAKLKSETLPVGEIGLVQFQFERIKIGRLQDVDIEPAYQGRGLGNHLLAAIVQQADLLGLDALCLKADSDDWPLQWYMRRGFTPVGEWMS